MHTKSRAIATTICLIIFISFIICVAVISTDKETSEIKQTHPVLAKAEPLNMTEPLVESSNLTSEPLVESSNVTSEPLVESSNVTSEPLVESSNVTSEVEKEPTYPLTQEEIDLIALVTMGEAEGETELGKRLVIDTILNRVDHPSFPNTVYDVIYQPNQFSVMWNSRINRCYVMPEIVELVKEELLERTNYDCVFFVAGGYGMYGKPLFKECCHYFSSYN